MTAGIIIDPWKLGIFQRHLDEAGFKYDLITENELMFILKVQYSDQKSLSKLGTVINEAQMECETHGR